MSKHTPAPWRIEKRSDFKGVYDICSKDITDEEDEANARLIASAPELLELLQRALIDLQANPEVESKRTVTMIKQAIAKATK